MTNARILIVEDEAITVSALKRELASLGYQVAATASTADEALNAVELHKPDLVLMDITLAGTVNGIVAAVAIRGTGALSGRRIVGRQGSSIRCRDPYELLTHHAKGWVCRRSTVN